MPARPRLLLVEDHAILQQAVALALQARNIDVTCPPGLDAATVIATARAVQPQVALLDFYLDEGDSLPMVQPLVDIGAAVIMLTGATDERILAECVAAGAVGIVSKSEGLDALVAALERVLDGRPLLGESERAELLARARHATEADRQRLAPFERLTDRERQVLQLLTEGLQAEEIARREFVSLTTVRAQIRAILQKLDVHSQLAAVALARQRGWAA